MWNWRNLESPHPIPGSVRQTRNLASLGSFPRNAHFALRTFRKHAGPYGFAIGVLAAGIGIGTAVFSLVEAVLIAPLPFPSQDRIEVIQKADPRAGAGVIELAYPELEDLQKNVRAFSSVALMPTTLYGYGKIIQHRGHAPVQVESTPVSHDFFRVLGVKPMLGRDFQASDEHVGAAPVVILSESTWRRDFGADSSIVGRMTRLNGEGSEVIGVMAPGVEFPLGAGLWVPLGVFRETGNRAATYLQAIARRKPTYSHEQAAVQVQGLFRRMQREFPQYYSPSQEAVVTILPRYWAGSSRLQLLISLGASFLLLLTASLTASNLFVSRALARAPEIATRFSLGASAIQVWSQFAAEGLTAAALACVAGSALAWALMRLLVRLAPPGIPRLDAAALNPPVLLFAIAISLLTALACTVGPAALVSNRNIENVLRSRGMRLTAGRSGRRMQNAFTAGQTMMTLLLLCASLLIVLSVRAMLRADVGFSHRDAVTMNIALPGLKYTGEQRNRFYSTLLERLRATPGISSAGAALLRPLEGNIGWDMRYRAAFNLDKRPDELQLSNFEVVTPGYFAALGVPVLEGRDFDTRDTGGGQQVAIISRSLADRFRKLGKNPVGERLRLGPEIGPNWMKIVGVVENTRDRGVVTAGDDIYVPYLQAEIPVRYLAVQGQLPPRQIESLVKREVKALDPEQAVASIATLQDLIDRDTARQRFNMTLLVTFGLGALLLASAGVYSVISEGVSARTQEIGIRMALGANRATLLRNLLSTTIRWVIAGEAAGLFAVFIAGRFAEGWLYSVHPRNPPVLAAAAGFLLITSVVAGSVPAWMSTKRPPSESLRVS